MKECKKDDNKFFLYLITPVITSCTINLRDQSIGCRGLNWDSPSLRLSSTKSTLRREASNLAQTVETLLETCATLTKQVANLEQDKIAQAIEITKLKKRVRRRMHPKKGKIAKLDVNEDVTLVDVKEDMNADDTDEAEPAEVEEVIKVFIAAKLRTEVVTNVATTITDAQVPKASALRRRRGVVIQDLEETATALVVVHTEARKNMMIYLKNMAGFKMDFFKGMTYNDIRPIHEKHYNSIKSFLKKGVEEVTVPEEGSKRKGYSLNQDAAKKQRIDEELILPVKKKYPLTRFTLEQMLNNVRLEVKEESKMSLELLKLVRRQILELMLLKRPKENTKCISAAGEELTAAKHKLKLLV
nr:hypothetical protein [Tanacetum cinerariifolium]